MYSRRIMLCLTVLVLILLTALPGFSSSENLLENGSFTELDEDGLPLGWYTDAYILESGYSVFQTEEGDSEHPCAAGIQNIGENDARFAQVVDVEPDTLYCLSGYILADDVSGGHGANLSVEGVYAFSDSCYDTEGEWRYIEYYGETGPEQDYIIVYARLGGYSGTCTGKALFADMSLTKVNETPGDIIADLWFREAASEDDVDDPGEDHEADSFRIWLILIIIFYTILALYAISLHRDCTSISTECKGRQWNWAAPAVLLLSMALRMMISALVEGYMVDVNCFLSWGHTLASVGPSQFYQATSFCDYPPLYTYVLGMNSSVTGLLGGSAPVTRIVFRFIPSLCDLVACWILYRMLLAQKQIKPSLCLVFFAFMAFHPASVLNSAAWGQMDSVLCLLLLTVAITAVEGKWAVTLPVYVTAVLVKPQALMLGPLGLIYIILSWIRNPEQRKRILLGSGISVAVFAAGMIPFTGQQNWDWLIQLYSRTLSSYPYATINTANLYYLLGGNWSAVGNSAHLCAPIILAALAAMSGICWRFRTRRLKLKHSGIETAISLLFACGFLILAVMQASWAWVGGFAMAFAFAIVISPAVRTGELRLLPWLGGLLFILLYVFGVKMHERYLFPAFLLLAAAWVMLRDRRILYVVILFGFTVFLNEGIVLDNSICLGSQLGHLNSDTVWIADVLSTLNIAGACYAVWLSTELMLHEPPHAPEGKTMCGGREWKEDRQLHWNRKDTVIVSVATAVFAVMSLMTLGSTKAPQTVWTSSSPDEQVIFDLGEYHEDFEILYFAQVSRNDFSISVSTDGEIWQEETWAQMDQGQCWKWKYVTESYQAYDGERSYYNSDTDRIIRFSGRYIRLTAQQISLKLNEILFRTAEGTILPATILEQLGAVGDSELFSDPAALLDEQDTLEGLPSLFAQDISPAQPSWWNSTYFDEIYHARTAYEFLKGTVPYETSHPPLGKVLMSAFVAVFGMTPFGWRFAGALAGILMLPGMYLLAKQLTKKTWIASLAMLLMMLDCMHLTQTQIATIDSFPVLFIIFAYYFMIRFLQTDFSRENLRVSLVSLGLSGLFMGFSIASKWIGIYAGAGLAILFFWHCWRIIRLDRDRKKTLQGKETELSAVRNAIRISLWCILFFILVPAMIYLLSYIPYMAYNFRKIHSLTDYIKEVWNAQVGMLNYHSTPNLGMDHPFYSPWWEWPIIGKPMYYAAHQYIPDESSVHHSIFCFGNPVIWFGGLASLAWNMIRLAGERRYRIQNNERNWHIRALSFDPRYLFILIGILAQYLPWVLVPRGTYIYHYFASLPFLMLSGSLAFDCFSEQNERIMKIASFVVLAAAAVFFILLFPYASGMNAPDAWLDIGKKILRIWY